MMGVPLAWVGKCSRRHHHRILCNRPRWCPEFSCVRLCHFRSRQAKASLRSTGSRLRWLQLLVSSFQLEPGTRSQSSQPFCTLKKAGNFNRFLFSEPIFTGNNREQCKMMGSDWKDEDEASASPLHEIDPTGQLHWNDGVSISEIGWRGAEAHQDQKQGCILINRSQTAQEGLNVIKIQFWHGLPIVTVVGNQTSSFRYFPKLSPRGPFFSELEARLSSSDNFVRCPTTAADAHDPLIHCPRDWLRASTIQYWLKNTFPLEAAYQPISCFGVAMKIALLGTVKSCAWFILILHITLSANLWREA